MATLVDSYSESNYSATTPILSGGAVGTALGQSFTCSSAGLVLSSCKFYIYRGSSASGSIYAKLYSHSGTYGTSSLPNSLLATSDAVACSSVPTGATLVTFTFSGANRVTLSATNYVVVIQNTTSTLINVGNDWTSSSHNGNPCLYNTAPAWVSQSNDLIFYVYAGESADSTRNIYTKGVSTSSSDKNTYTRGSLTGSSDRLLHTIAGGVTYSERGLYSLSGVGNSDRGLYMIGKPNPVAIPFYQGKNDKKYSVKIYDRAGTTFKGNYDPIGGYAFTKTINGGVGALSITLPRKFDNFGLGEDVNLLDEIQVWVQDKDTSGKKIYSGYVSSITSFIDGSNQGIKLDVLGYVSRLAFTLDWDGTNISMVRNSLTAGELVKDVIDKYRSTVSEERINYGTGTVDITGSDISYTSNAKSCLETIERAREMAGATWYWYVDADNVFYFREYATTPTHLFTFGKDISSLEITRSADDIKNEFIFWNGLMADDTNFISNRYYNTASISAYWNRFESATDGRVTSTASADALGDSYINAYKNPNVSMRFEVKDNNFGAGYDIESIEPGHTCKILNLNDSDVVGDNMVITSVQYTPERAIIYVSDLREITGRSLTNLRRQLDSTVYGDRPTKLTSKAIT